MYKQQENELPKHWNGREKVHRKIFKLDGEPKKVFELDLN